MSENKRPPVPPSEANRDANQETWWFGTQRRADAATGRQPVGVGTRLGRYQVRGLLGAGGMGQVYDAYDQSLDREVALKALGPTFGDDSAGLRRLEREARVLAALSHPNIATIYGFEEVDEAAYLVLEKVEGGNLASRLERGKLEVESALAIAIQVAQGLAEAHRKGVIHRDLKPSNVMMGASGQIKLVDFGLAKSVRRSPDEPALTNLTAADAILGTAPYMSPEQVRGDELDTRTDVWAFGCLLFEMLSGRPPFVGRTPPETLAAVLRDEPPFGLLASDTPAALVRLLRRCLSKELEQRPQHIDDLALELIAIQGELTQPVAAVTSTAAYRPPKRHTWLSAAVGVAAAVAAVLATLHLWPKSEQELLALSLELPRALTPTQGYPNPFALAPDGSSLVVAAREGAETRLYLRRLADPEVIALPGTEEARTPFFSPDGRSVGFFDERKLVTVALSDRSAIPRAEVGTNSRGAAWLPDGSIVLSPTQTSGLLRLPSPDQPAVPLTELDAGAGETSHRWPEALPSGRWVLFTVGLEGRSYDEARIDAAALGTGERRVVLEGGSYPRYATSGHLVFVRSGRLYAVGFDASTLTFSGEPEILVPGVRYDPQNGAAHVALSATGALLYAPGLPSSPEAHLAWLDADGTIERLPGGVRAYRDLRLAPDGSRVALVIGGWTDSDLRVLYPNGSLTQLTFGLAPHRPTWKPDGRHITVAVHRGGRWQLVSVDAEAPGEEQILYESERQLYPGGWTPDGGSLVFQEHTPEAGWDLRILTPQAPAEARVRSLAATPFHEANAAVSPDGRLVAYESDELDGLVQVSVRRLPDGTARTLVSAAGARWPVWGADGSLYFWDTTSHRFATARVQDREGQLLVEAATPALPPAIERRLVDRIRVAVNGARFDVDPIGNRLLVLELPTAGEAPPLTQPIVLVGWQQRLSSSRSP